MSAYDYDIVVLGAGAAGLVASGFAAALGARTLLVERDRTGGDCTWSGCVPSKALVRAARVAHTIRTAGRFGIDAADPEIDFAAVMQAVRATRQGIYDHADAPEKIRARNVELEYGAARFLDPHTIAIEGADGVRRLTTRYCVVATGSSPLVPHIAGMPMSLLHTSATIFEISERPRNLIVLGGGPAGIELAQAFARLGSRVSVVEREHEILPASEYTVSQHVRQRLEAEGIAIHTGSALESVSSGSDGHSALVASGERWASLRFDAVLATIGRSPNVDDLGLENAGVRYTERGITINHSCQTSASHIYACGDATDALHFTHVAEDMARTAVMRLLLKVPAAYERRSVPRVTFCDPEVGQLGMTAAQLDAANIRFETIRFPFERLDRAVIDQTEGFAMVHVASVSGKILGAHVVGECAGELINEFALAMHNGLSLRDISGTVHAYPTYTLGVRRVADQWYVRSGSTRLVDTVRSIFGYRGKPSEGLGTKEII